MSVHDDIRPQPSFAILNFGIEKQEKARRRDARSAPSRSACGQRVPMVIWCYFSRSRTARAGPVRLRDPGNRKTSRRPRCRSPSLDHHGQIQQRRHRSTRSISNRSRQLAGSARPSSFPFSGSLSPVANRLPKSAGPNSPRRVSQPDCGVRLDFALGRQKPSEGVVERPVKFFR